ncbi:MAG: hypothetical protein ACRC2H_01610, partial [Silanimonas sp.]
RLLAVLLAGKPLDFDAAPRIATWAARTEGLSGRELRSLVEAAELAAVARAIEAGQPQSVALRAGDFGFD